MKMLLPVLLMLATGKTILPGEVKVKTLPPESREVLDYLPRNIVIAHRGTTYWHNGSNAFCRNHELSA